jgi:hypothetical protein
LRVTPIRKPLLNHPSIANAFNAHKTQAVCTQVDKLGVIEVRPLLVRSQQLKYGHTPVAARAIGEVEIARSRVLWPH